MSSFCARAAWLKPRSLRSCRTREPTNVFATLDSITTVRRLASHCWQIGGCGRIGPVGVIGRTKMAGIAGSTGLAKVMMPVPDPHPDVFDVQWPLRVADIDREGRLRFDAATRHIQDIGTDHLRELGFEETHPLWIVRRTMIDLVKPIEFQDMLRL